MKNNFFLKKLLVAPVPVLISAGAFMTVSLYAADADYYTFEQDFPQEEAQQMTLGGGSHVPVLNSVAEIDLPALDVGYSVLGGTQVGVLSTDITATGAGVGIGIQVKGADAEGVDSRIEHFNGTITATSINGTTASEEQAAIGIDLVRGTIASLDGATITVVADEDGSSTTSAAATGIKVGSMGAIGSLDDVTVNVSSGGRYSAVTAMSFESGSQLLTSGTGAYFMENATVTVKGNAGKLSFVSGPLSQDVVDNGSLGKISGTFTMESMNDGKNEEGGISVGYIIGGVAKSTSVAVGFQNTTTDAASTDVQNTSAGYNIDWENTTMSVHRHDGLSGAAAIFGAQDALELGAGSSLSSSVDVGMTVTAWFNGVDMTDGAILGSLNAKATAGLAVGLSTTGTDLLKNNEVVQSADNTKIGYIGGDITAVLQSDAEAVYGPSWKPIAVDSMVVGYLGATVTLDPDTQFGAGKHFKTDMTGAFTGEITAQLNDITSADGALREGTLVAGIVNYGTIDDAVAASLWGTGAGASTGSDLLKFDGNAYIPTGFESEGNNDVAGTSVTAIVYDSTGSDTKQAVGLGQAIMSIVGDTELTTTSTGAANTTRLVGDITTGAGLSGASQGTESLSFQEGHFTVTSTNWNAAEAINFGKFDPDTVEGIMTTTVQLSNIIEVDSNATVAEGLGDHIALNTSTLNFAGVNETNVSQLIAGDGMSLTLNGLNSVNVELAETVDHYKTYFENGGGPIFFVDARKAEFFDTEQVNYNLTIGGLDVPYSATDNFRIYHDENGIYLYDKEYRIPEPSTATLSLIALAGLLARRRRRKN